MRNHTAVTRAIVVAQCTLAIAFFAIGMGVKASWAGSAQSYGLKITPISSFQYFNQAALCTPKGYNCGVLTPPCCEGLSCLTYDKGKTWTCK
jgi:hypothetical protein